MSKPLLTTKELTEILKVDSQTILNFERLGMPTIRVGQKFKRFDLNSVKKWLKEKSKGEESNG